MGGSCSHNLTSGMREVEDIPCQHQRVANYRVALAMSCMGDDEGCEEQHLGAMLVDCVVPLGPTARSRSASSLCRRRGECISGEGRIGCGEEESSVSPHREETGQQPPRAA